MIYVYLLAITSGMRTPEPRQTVPGPDPAREREGPPPPPDALPVQKETNKNSEKDSQEATTNDVPSKTKTKSRVIREAEAEEDDLPRLHPSCHWEKIRKIRTDPDDPDQRILMINYYTTAMIRINTIKMINLYNQEQEVINGNIYSISHSPIAALNCVTKNKEITISNLEQQEAFLEDFKGRTNHSAIMDFFSLGPHTCLLTHPVPVLFQGQERCQENLRMFAYNLSLPDDPNWKLKLAEVENHTLVPYYLNQEGYHVHPPLKTVCLDSMLEMDLRRNKFLVLQQQLESKLLAIDSIMETNYVEEFDQFLETDCEVSRRQILKEGIPIQKLEECEDLLMASRRSKRQVRLINFDNNVNIGQQPEILNEDLGILRGNQNILDQEVSKMRTAQKVLFAIETSVASVLEADEELIRGNSAQLALNKHLQSQIASFNSASDQILLDIEIMIRKLDAILQHIHAKIHRDQHCHDDHCTRRNGTTFYQGQYDLIAVVTEDKISSQEVPMIQCRIDAETNTIPQFNYGKVTDIKSKTVKIVKNGGVQTYPKECLIDPAKTECGLTEPVSDTILTHGIYLTTSGNQTYAQCPHKLVIIDKDQDARTKLCHLEAILVNPPVYIPSSGKTVGDDIFTSVSFLDLPNAVTLSRINLLHHQNNLDYEASETMRWLWSASGEIRDIVPIPSQHLFATLALVLGILLLTLLLISLYCCRSCGLFKLSSCCLTCKTRTLTVERQEHGSNREEAPSRSFVRIMTQSLSCCRSSKRAESLDLAQLADQTRTASGHDTTGAVSPMHASTINSLNDSIRHLDKHLESQAGPPPYHVGTDPAAGPASPAGQHITATAPHPTGLRANLN